MFLKTPLKWNRLKLRLRTLADFFGLVFIVLMTAPSDPKRGMMKKHFNSG
jgi:hypothetical protein